MLFFLSRHLRNALSAAQVVQAPLNAQIYHDFEKSKSKLEVASRFIASQRSLASNPGHIPEHPVVMGFPEYDDVIVCTVIGETYKGMRTFALEHQYVEPQSASVSTTSVLVVTTAPSIITMTSGVSTTDNAPTTDSTASTSQSTPTLPPTTIPLSAAPTAHHVPAVVITTSSDVQSISSSHGVAADADSQDIQSEDTTSAEAAR